MGHFRHPEHCALFLNCHSHKAYVQQCPGGMYFSDISNTCETQHKVDCGSRWTTELTSYGSGSERLMTSGSHQSTVTTHVDKAGKEVLPNLYM